ncbi:MAG TPA: carbon storage regulator, partial [Marisediminicola sp.]|nr:carbon storage regulator [Marisediminicola sp.]
TVLDTRGDGVRIGIDAPKGVRIQREEIVRAVTESNVAASQATLDDENRIKAALGLAPAAAIVGPIVAVDSPVEDASST